MRRFVIGAAAILLGFQLARAQAPAEIDRTAAIFSALQGADGGFSIEAGEPSNLGATSSAIRVLKNVRGSIKDVPGCLAFVLSCRDKATGGFAPTPGGKPSVAVTASALMALAELKVKDGETIDGAVKYLAEDAKAFEEIRIAVAGMEAVGKTSPVFKEWIAKVKADRNDDGTFGKGAGMPRATGSAAVALLRMGDDLDHKAEVLGVLKAGQKSDGGWGKDDGPSDLDTSYRVMRAFFMLKDRPDLDQLRSLIAKYRQPDGTYSSQPDKPGDFGGTYYATTILRWGRLMDGEPASIETAGLTKLFNGKNLDGWEGDKDLWSARDGMLVGKTSGLNHNDFLATDKSYGDFILQLSFRLIGDDGANSGVQFRSVRVPGHEMSGYQADIGVGWFGKLYDESRRNRVLVDAKPEAVATVRKGGWNHYTIRAMGDEIRLSLNGVTSVEYREDDPKVDRAGKIAVQIHAGGPTEVQFKDVWIQPLPTPTADDSTAPGFHLRTLKTPDGDRKYSVFIPKGYDGSKAFPAVLFLHGSGERGDDGIRGAQVGLGASINAHPDDFPAIAIFPQARKTWQADSDDAKAALAALDDAAKALKIDEDRVILTGLSMGGYGSWSIGAAHPERFAAVVPVCGGAKADAVQALKGVPLWAFLGDADSERIVNDTRQAVAALKEAGGHPRMTEYRDVGHNSWDRAYSDPALLEWMLAQSRKSGH